MCVESCTCPPACRAETREALAAALGHAINSRLSLSRAPLPQGKDEDERSLLHSACASGSLQLVQWLVERGANQVNAADEEVCCACCV